MTPEQHAQFLGALDEALNSAIRRYRALHHASLAELLEMQKEVNQAKELLERAVEEKISEQAHADSDKSHLDNLRTAVG